MSPQGANPFWSPASGTSPGAGSTVSLEDTPSPQPPVAPASSTGALPSSVATAGRIAGRPGPSTAVAVSSAPGPGANRAVDAGAPPPVVSPAGAPLYPRSPPRPLFATAGRIAGRPGPSTAVAVSSAPGPGANRAVDAGAPPPVVSPAGAPLYHVASPTYWPLPQASLPGPLGATPHWGLPPPAGPMPYGPGAALYASPSSHEAPESAAPSAPPRTMVVSQ
jgi:hypothetical protein